MYRFNGSFSGLQCSFTSPVNISGFLCSRSDAASTECCRRRLERDRLWSKGSEPKTRIKAHCSKNKLDSKVAVKVQPWKLHLTAFHQHASAACLNQLPDTEVNYASLDLKLAKQRKNKARQQGRDAPQGQPPVRHATPANAFLEVNNHVDAELPSRDTSTMVSHSSIYLNSQQIAQEAEGVERERSYEGENLCWDGVRCCADGYSEREAGRDRQSYSNGSECTQLSEVEAGQSDCSLGESNQNN